MKISLAQLNYHIGNFEKNRDLIVNSIRKAKSVGSDLIVFSELCIPGYPPLDLLDRLDFIEKCNRTLEEIALECKGIAAIVGCPTINPNPQGKKLYNSALVLQDGKVIFRTNKALLPTYDIFDEYRYFEPEKSFRTFVFKGVRIALAICEDLWDEQPFDNEFEKSRLYTVSPVEELSKERPDIIISISASPFAYNKIEAKENIFRKKAVKYRIPVISVNQTGANTELIFDGASLVMNREGELVRKLPFFEEALETISLEEINSGKISYSHQKPEVISLVHKALLTGLSDYLSKTGFRSCILGLSGGIDSAVVCCLAAEALGIDNVNALLLPSRYSSEHSVTDSIALAKNLGIKYEVISIEKPFTAFEELVKPFFAGKEPDVTEENIQSRTRAVILMAFANKFGHILLNTSNKSETAVGYGTLYGDMAGGLSVIGDVYKTDVYKLAEYINRNKTVIPESIIRKPPSAELKPNQLDTDSLPEYKILDKILYQYIELQKPPEKIEGSDDKTIRRVIRMINTNEYKRYQTPPALRISSKAFGEGRKMPLAAKY